MGIARLVLTNGTIRINLIQQAGMLSGFHLEDWQPAIAGMKGGGVWRDSIMGDGRALVERRWENVFETFSLGIAGDQTTIIDAQNSLRALLEDARNYWLPLSAVTTPVWIEAQSDCEDYARYAYIYDWDTPNDNNPYGTAFGGAAPSVSGFLLTIERGHWMGVDPSAANQCLTLDGSYSYPTFGGELLSNASFETAGGGGADVFANWTESAGDGAIARATGAGNFLAGSGTASAQLTSGATFNTYVQQNFVATPLAEYTLTFYYRNVTSVLFSPRFQVLDLTGAVDIVAESILYPTLNTVDFIRVSQKFTAPAGCISVGIRFYCPPSAAGRVALIDAASCMKVTPTTFGRAATCNAEVFSANKSSLSQLTHIFTYDDSAATFSANLISAALPYDIFPNPVAAADFLYLGVYDGAFYSAPFTNLVFDLDQITAGALRLSPQYWNGAAWTGFTSQYDLQTNITGVSNTKEGVSYFNFRPPASWTRTVVNGVFGWWIRMGVAALSGTPRFQQVNRQIYTANRPYFSVPASALPGEVSSLLKLDMKASPGPGITEITTAPILRYHISSRLTARGSSFDPYIILSPHTVPNGVTITAAGFGYSFLTFHNTTPEAPGGWYADFNGLVANDTDSLNLTIAYPVCDHYRGTFRLYLRYQVVSGTTTVTVDSLRAALKYTGSPITLSGTGIALADLGKFTFPLTRISDLNMESIALTLALKSIGAASRVKLYDLLFLPVDEISVEVNAEISQTDPRSNQSNLIDSLDPRATILGLAINASNYVSGALTILSNTPLQLPPGKASRIQIITLDDNAFTTSFPEPQDLFIPRGYVIPRYFSTRGDQ
jgi:hypothetical protein